MMLRTDVSSHDQHEITVTGYVGVLTLSSGFSQPKAISAKDDYFASVQNEGMLRWMEGEKEGGEDKNKDFCVGGVVWRRSPT